jgi:uncharacterized protein (TIGR00369 family)
LKKRVVKKHNAAKHCFVCGVENSFGLHTDFYELEDSTLAAIVIPQEQHQSYPGRVHGGVSTALLDETIGRAVNVAEPDTWAVTVELTTRYKKPVPYGVPLTVGEVAVTATGKYMKLKLENIADFDAAGETWESYPRESDPEWVDVPAE